jgi:hypothetical protein
MLSQSARIGAPVVGFAVGLLMTYGLADAGPGPVPTKEGVNYVSPPNPSWVVQLIGDSSEAVAVSRFRELQNKNKLLLGMYKPVVLNTAITPGSEPIWTRIRVELSSREARSPLARLWQPAHRHASDGRSIPVVTPLRGDGGGEWSTPPHICRRSLTNRGDYTKVL